MPKSAINTCPKTLKISQRFISIKKQKKVPPVFDIAERKFTCISVGHISYPIEYFQGLARDFDGIRDYPVVPCKMQNAKSRMPWSRAKCEIPYPISRVPWKMGNPVSRIPWSREKSELPFPHKRVPRKYSNACYRTNYSRGKIEVPHSVNRRTRNPDVVKLAEGQTRAIYTEVPSHRFNSLRLIVFFFFFFFRKHRHPMLVWFPLAPQYNAAKHQRNPFLPCLESRESSESGADDTHTAKTDIAWTLTRLLLASPAVAGSRTKNPVESRRGCIPPVESRGDRIPYKKTRWVPSWLHPVESNPFKSRRGYIPSRGIPRWPDLVQKKSFSAVVAGSRTNKIFQSRGCRIPYKK